MKFLDFIDNIRKQTISFFSFQGGSYSTIFVTSKPVQIDDHPNQYWLLKRPQVIHQDELPMNLSERITRKFREIHPEIPIYKLFPNQGFFIPFMRNKTNDDNLIADVVLDIYQKTRQIIADGCIPSNFAFFEDKLVCIDMDLAIRRGSILSDAYFNEIISTDCFDEFFSESAISYRTPKTMETIRTLFYIEEQLDGIEYEHQKITRWILNKLHHYRERQLTFNLESIKLLERIEAFNPEVDPKLLEPRFIEQFKSQQVDIANILIQIEALTFVQEVISLRDDNSNFFANLKKRRPVLTTEEVQNFISRGI